MGGVIEGLEDLSYGMKVCPRGWRAEGTPHTLRTSRTHTHTHTLHCRFPGDSCRPGSCSLRDARGLRSPSVHSPRLSLPTGPTGDDTAGDPAQTPAGSAPDPFPASVPSQRSQYSPPYSPRLSLTPGTRRRGRAAPEGPRLTASRRRRPGHGNGRRRVGGDVWGGRGHAWATPGAASCLSD